MCYQIPQVYQPNDMQMCQKALKQNVKYSTSATDNRCHEKISSCTQNCMQYNDFT